MTNVDIHAIVSTIEKYHIEQLFQFLSVITVQSTVTNNNSVQQAVIDLAPILPNSRITLFSYSNIQGNVTIIFTCKNDLLKSYA